MRTITSHKFPTHMPEAATLQLSTQGHSVLSLTALFCKNIIFWNQPVLERQPWSWVGWWPSVPRQCCWTVQRYLPTNHSQKPAIIHRHLPCIVPQTSSLHCARMCRPSTYHNIVTYSTHVIFSASDNICLFPKFLIFLSCNTSANL